jgi:hypothetical protein
MIADTTYANLPPILDIVEPIIEEAPSTLQNDLTDLIIALYRASSNETSFLLKHILNTTQNPMTVITLRRISVDFPPPLQAELRELLRPQSISMPRVVESELTKNDDFVSDDVVSTSSIEKKPRKKNPPRKPKDDSAPVKKRVPRIKKVDENG